MPRSSSGWTTGTFEPLDASLLKRLGEDPLDAALLERLCEDQPGSSTVAAGGGTGPSPKLDGGR